MQLQGLMSVRSTADDAAASAAPPRGRVIAGLWTADRWGHSPRSFADWISAAVDADVTRFDHADIYGGYSVEALFGQALTSTPGLRDRLEIITKCGIRLVDPARPEHRIKHYDTSRQHVRASVHGSLQALCTDRLDLLLVHRPDPLTHPDDLAATLAELQAEGKVLRVGVSNHDTRQLTALHRRASLSAHQFECSVLRMAALADGTLAQCADIGIEPMLWSPLAHGRVLHGADEQSSRVRSALQSLADARGVSPAAVALAWLMSHPSRPSVVTGTRRLQGLRDARAASDLVLDRQTWTAVWQASMGHELD